MDTEIEIALVEELQLEDGCWRMTFDLNEMAKSAFVKIGIMHVLMTAAEAAIEEHGEG